MPTENPPWVERVLKDNWDAMEAIVGPRLMPKSVAEPTRGLTDEERLILLKADRGGPLAPARAMLESLPQRQRLVELGAGHYGVVFDTGRKEVVLKITSDPTEAQFILAGLSLGKWPAGIVRYIDMLRLPMTYRRRPVYAIWREKAISTGDILPRGRGVKEPYHRQARAEFGALLYSFMVFAAELRKRSKRSQTFYKEVAEAEDMDVWEEAAATFQHLLDLFKRRFQDRGFADTPKMPYRGKMRTAVALTGCQIAAEYMQNTYGATEVGGALAFYLDHGIVLADVHTFNVGQVRRGSDTITVITDPGHAVFLTPRFDPLFRRADVQQMRRSTQILAEHGKKKRRKKRNPSMRRLLGI